MSLSGRWFESGADASLAALYAPGDGRRVAFHSPCSLQHGQRLQGVVEPLLSDAGLTLTPVPNAHSCCGSAGTYSLLQADLARQLRDRKVDALESGSPSVIATANIGCLTHMDPVATVPVRHWIEIIDSRLAAGKG